MTEDSESGAGVQDAEGRLMTQTAFTTSDFSVFDSSHSSLAINGAALASATNNFTPNPASPPSPTEPPTPPILPPSPLPPPLPTWVLGAPGGDCHDACSNSGGRVCAEVDEIDWPTSPQSLPEAHCEGLGSAERCDMGECPLKTATMCYYCSDTVWYTSPRTMCHKRAGDRVRICPCRWASPPQPPPEPPASQPSTPPPGCPPCNNEDAAEPERTTLFGAIPSKFKTPYSGASTQAPVGGTMGMNSPDFEECSCMPLPPPPPPPPPLPPPPSISTCEDTSTGRPKCRKAKGKKKEKLCQKKEYKEGCQYTCELCTISTCEDTSTGKPKCSKAKGKKKEKLCKKMAYKKGCQYTCELCPASLKEGLRYQATATDDYQATATDKGL